MVIDLNKTLDEGLELELFLAPPSPSPPPRHSQQQSEEPSPLQPGLLPPQSEHEQCTRNMNDRPIGILYDLLPIEPLGPRFLCPQEAIIRSIEPLGPRFLCPQEAMIRSIEPLGPRFICPQEAMIHELAPLQLRPFQPGPILEPWPTRVGPLQASVPTSSQPGLILEPWPTRAGPLQASVPTPPLKRRQYKRKENDDISTEPVPSPCSSSTNHPEPAVTKVRRKRSKADDKEIEPAYPWSTNRRAKIHTMEYLQSNNIVTITGEVECNQCKEKYDIEYDLVSKFEELVRFIARNGEDCNNRAPSSWSTPIPLNCKMCNQQNCVEAVIPKRDFDTINWLFLLLGQMLGNLQLDQLKYFCTHTNHHRTGAKDRLLYLTYITLCEQLTG